jgi:hypothetical protein
MWPITSKPLSAKSWPRLCMTSPLTAHHGAQLTFTDVDGHRVTALLTDTSRGVIGGQAAGLELRHRQHARVEDRILLRGSADLLRDVA